MREGLLTPIVLVCMIVANAVPTLKHRASGNPPVQRRLTEEFERCQVYLDAGTRKPLVYCVEAQLLERHVNSILDKGFELMVQQHRIEDLARLYALASRVRALDQLKAALKENIKKTGLALVMDVEKVQLLLRFVRRRY